jgi:tRNA U34 5-methylaminomethyl-2-thiouridine-forming methyltransferase MnmC
MILFAGGNGYVDDVPVEQVQAFEKELLSFLDSVHPELEQAIAKDRSISEETEKKLRSAIEDYRQASPLVQKAEVPKPAPAETRPAAKGPVERARAAAERQVTRET